MPEILEPIFEPPDPKALVGPEPRTGAPAELAPPEAVAAVLARERERLLALPGVTMVGYGRDGLGRDVIFVGVESPDRLAALPASVDDVPIVGTVTGPIEALARTTR